MSFEAVAVKMHERALQLDERLVALKKVNNDLIDRSKKVLEALEASQAATHVIVLKDQATSAALRAAARLEGNHLLDSLHQRDLVLARGPRRTGGQRRDLLMSTATRDALGRLAGILTSQYEVVYSRPASLIPPEQIAVRMRRNDLTAQGTPVRRTGG